MSNPSGSQNLCLTIWALSIIDQAVPTTRSTRGATNFHVDFQLLNDVNGWKIKGFRKIAVYGRNGGPKR